MSPSRTSPWRWPLYLGWLIASTAVGALACFLPLTETPGYELALLVSLISSLGAGQLAACLPGRVRAQLAPFPGARAPAAVLFGRAALYGLSLLAPPLLLSLLNTLRVPPCNLAEGLLFYALIPLPSVLVAAAAGLLAGLIAPGPRSASVAWAAIWILGLGLALWEFYDTPAVFSFGPFHGYYPGVLYDELVSVPPRLFSYRAATAVQIVALLAIASWLVAPDTLRLSAGRLRSRPRAAGTAALAVAASAALQLAAPALGHRTRGCDLESLLPVSAASPGLELRFPPGTPKDTIDELTLDVAFSLHRVERFLDAPLGEEISVFFFSDSQQKGRAMGASGTNVAKPWRNEVYVVLRPAPHEVLRHELAHAVAARFAPPPFDVAGGWFPDPGLIEGLAVAAQGPRGDLSVHQWAAAMLSLDLLPPAESLFGPGFLDLPASSAYTAAGSFCRWIVETRGPESLRDAYAGRGWKRAAGSTLPELEKEWRLFLEGVELRDADLAAARHRFDRPSVIRTVCVHEVARLRREAGRLERSGRWDAALETLELARERSGRSTSVRLDVFAALARAGRVREVRRRAEDLLSDPAVGSVQRDRIREVLADLRVDNDPERAREAYLELAATAPSEAARRRLAVKARLARLPSGTVGEIRAALAHRPGPAAPGEPLLMLHIARAAGELPGDPVLRYLLARQHFRYDDFEVALAQIDRALELKLASAGESLELEAKIMRGRCLLGLDRRDEAARELEKIAGDARYRTGARERAADLAARAVFEPPHSSGETAGRP
ncbi:MAG: hypothetical protein R6V85_01990 [Polyangia bacterium]